MASSFEKQLLASQTFLNGVRALPSFEDQRTKQFQHICLKIGKIKLKTEQIAKIFAIFEEGLWGPHADELKSALANSNEVDVVMPRKKNQDFLFLVNYIPKTIWESLERDDCMAALEKLCAHAIKLGLQHPSETTQGLLLACVFDREGSMLETQRWRITEQYKAVLKRFFDRAPDPPVYLLVLPRDPKELSKVLWDRTFDQDESPAIWAKGAALMEIGKAWPMRTTHSASSGTRIDPRDHKQSYVTKDELLAFGTMVAGAVRREEQTSSIVAGLKILKSQSLSSSLEAAPLLALKNAPENEEVKPASSQAQECPRSSTAVEATANAPESTAPRASGVKQTLQALRESCHEKQKPKGATKTRTATVKRPASKVLKRPGAKKPAQKKSARPAVEVLDREARRQRILALVPKALQEQYKDGCGKCYWRAYCTPSCWKLRGYGADL